jgi:GntR family transcriptional regulator/MocR family aminotransferase
VIVNGSQQALDLAARVLMERGDRVVIEDPQYQGTRRCCRRGREAASHCGGCRGLDPGRLPARARMAFVTPSHQFPTGTILRSRAAWRCSSGRAAQMPR